MFYMILDDNVGMSKRYCPYLDKHISDLNLKKKMLYS